jgi:hypothetical protein
VVARGSGNGLERHIRSEQLVACLTSEMVVQAALELLQVALAVLESTATWLVPGNKQETSFEHARIQRGKG